jgi:hypothetical protein
MRKLVKESINENIIDNVKGFFNPSVNQLIKKINNKVGQFDQLLIDANYDADSFITFVDYCQDVLEYINKLAGKDIDIINEVGINKFIEETLDTIAESFPRKIVITVASEDFIEQLRNVLAHHSKLATLYNTKRINVGKFNVY